MLQLAEHRKKQIVITSDFHYDLLIGGYVKPGDFLNHRSTKRVQDAIATIQEFEELLRKHNILEDY